ncbi:MAG: putative GntR-family transcriptional regulator [Acidimicrobiia bacterium]|nr:putative GntR-family transcriptional regulator [Acidimicrobiia bacterium]
MTVTIDEQSTTPAFEQVRSQLEQAIIHGRLESGARLPTVRQLAHDLGLAPNTVARSYRALEEAGLVETHGRHGTTVTQNARMSPARRAHVLADAAAAYYAEVTRVGATVDDAVDALRRVALDHDTAALVAAPLPLADAELEAK